MIEMLHSFWPKDSAVATELEGMLMCYDNYLSQQFKQVEVTNVTQVSS